MAEIGSTLREARMRARIDITEVESRTKIRAKYLRAIENEEWDLLPGPVYVKSFLRTYGDYLGLDSRMLIDEYRRRYEHPSDHDLRPMGNRRHDLEHERERRHGPPSLSPRMVVGLVLIAVVAALYLIGRGSSSPSRAVPAPSAARRDTHHRRRNTATRTAGTTPIRPTHPGAVRLKLAPTTTAVYVCVVNEHGTKLIPGVIYSPGQTIPVVRARELLVTLGNNAVQMSVNGRPVSVSASSSAIGLRVLPRRVTALSSAQEPTCR
jgi:cytoskeleton protein RodZ